MHHINTVSTQNDLQILQGKQKDLEIDLQQQQKHLIEALLAKDKLAKELVALKDGSMAAEALKQVSHPVLPCHRSLSTEDIELHAELEAVGMKKSCIAA